MRLFKPTYFDSINLLIVPDLAANFKEIYKLFEVNKLFYSGLINYFFRPLKIPIHYVIIWPTLAIMRG